MLRWPVVAQLGQIAKSSQKFNFKKSWNWLIIHTPTTVWQILKMKAEQLPQTEMAETYFWNNSWNYNKQNEVNSFLVGFFHLEPLCVVVARSIDLAAWEQHRQQKQASQSGREKKIHPSLRSDPHLPSPTSSEQPLKGKTSPPPPPQSPPRPPRPPLARKGGDRPKHGKTKGVENWRIWMWHCFKSCESLGALNLNCL